MKKFALGLLFLLTLSGCSSTQLNSGTAVSSESVQIETSATSVGEVATASTENPLQDLEEYDKLATVLDLNDVEVTTLTDSSEKRVLLFTKDNQKAYKSVFVKSTQFLKIVDLQNNDVELFYGSI